MGHLKERVARGDVVLGVALSYPATGIGEEIAQGWDFVWVDGQHGQMDYARMFECVRVMQGMGQQVLVRVPDHQSGFIGPVLDMAPNALMVPMVDTAQQAKDIVRVGRFSPLGNRSFGGKRPDTLFGREYYIGETDRILLVAQIETPEAVDNVQAIAAVEGIDTLFFGPDDMKIRMGAQIGTAIEESDELRAAMAKVARAAAQAGKTAGIVAGTPEAMKCAVAAGYRLIIGGSDIGFLRNGSRSQLAKLRASRD